MKTIQRAKHEPNWLPCRRQGLEAVLTSLGRIAFVNIAKATETSATTTRREGFPEELTRKTLLCTPSSSCTRWQASKQEQLEELAQQDEKHSPLRPYVIITGRISQVSISSCSSNGSGGSVASDAGSDRFGVVLKLVPCVCEEVEEEEVQPVLREV